MANEISVWNKVMSSALSMPGVNIDRASFLRTELRPYCNEKQLEKAVSTSPVGVLSLSTIEKLADACINNHTTKVTALSGLSGLPGGWFVAATIPADIAQYYWHTFVLAQKLAYLYGMPDIRDEKGNLTEVSSDMLTLFVGVMMGAGAANSAIKNISKEFAKQVVKRLPQKALTKTVYYPIIKQVAKWIGIKLTKESFAKGLGKAIPILGGVLSAGLTFFSFRPGAKKLQKKLREQMYELNTYSQSTSNEDASEYSEYEEVHEETASAQQSTNPQYVITLFLINIAHIGGTVTSETEEYISSEIENPSLSDDEQLELAKMLESSASASVDCSQLKSDEVNSAILLEKGIGLLALQKKMSLAQKLYFKKTAQQLGYSKEDAEEMLNTLS